MIKLALCIRLRRSRDHFAQKVFDSRHVNLERNDNFARRNGHVLKALDWCLLCGSRVAVLAGRVRKLYEPVVVFCLSEGAPLRTIAPAMQCGQQ
jgi:hypothetical protein